MKTQYFDLTDLVGKQITEVYDDSDVYFLATADGFIGFKSVSGYYGEHSVNVLTSFNPLEYRRACVVLNLVSVDELARLVQEGEAKTQAQEEANARREFERLKARFQ